MDSLRYNNPLTKKNNEIDFLLIGVSVVIGLVVVVIIYYVYTYSSKKSHPSNTKVTTTTTKPELSQEQNNALKQESDEMHQDTLPGANQVFNIADNLFTYDDAEAVCKAHGAELADYNQLVEAYKKGANWCNYGWTKGQLALYPIQPEYWNKLQETKDEVKRGACGVPGINGGLFENKNIQLGVNCYGPKRAPKGDERLKDVFVSDKERDIMQKVVSFRKQLGNFKLSSFNEDKWHM